MTDARAPNTIGPEAAAALLQISPDELSRLVKAGAVRRAGPGRFIPAQLIRDYIAHLQREPDRKLKAPTQAEIAEHLDMSERNVRGVLVSLGIKHKRSTLDEIREAYIRHLREQAAGRRASSSDEYSIVRERALLTREQRDAQAMKNAVARGTYAPIEVLTATISNAGVIVSDALEALPVRIAQAVPDLPAEVRKLIAQTVDTVRNEAADKLASMDFGDDD